MAIEDIIRIRNDVTDTAPLQGIGGGGVSGNDTTVTLTVEPGHPLEITEGNYSIDEALWTAQTAIITGESEYLTQLNTQWKQTKNNLEGGVWDTIWTTVAETFEEILSLGVFALLAKYSIVLTGGQAAVVGVLVSLAASFGLDALKQGFIEWLREGNKLLEAMQAENDALLKVEQDRINYQHRNEVILRHERMISRLLTELDNLRRGAEQVTMKTGGGATTSDEEDGWDSVITSTTSAIDNLDEWVESMETQDASNLPVPSAPSLPTLPADPKKAVTRKVAFLLARYGFKLATELIRKQRETDTHMTDLVGKIDTLREAIENMDTSLVTGLGDLRWNDEVLYLPGNVRIHLKNRMIQYGK